MKLSWTKIKYEKLNARQKENYNYLKLSALLADYGYITHRLTDDWQGADFIAQHIDNGKFLKVQLKGRLTFGEKYREKELYVAFRHNEDWYMVPHDEALKGLLPQHTFRESKSWLEKKGYSFASLSPAMISALKPYRIG